MSAQSPRVSVILPVYNAERYLHDCLDSIIKQENVEFEVIIVNDGSTDKSELICSEYAKDDSRIKLYSIKNCGPANARNYGLAKAIGDYVVFIDADDTIKPGYLKIPLLPENNGYDIVFANYAISKGATIAPKTYLNCGEKIVDTDELKNLSLQQ